MIKIIRKSNKTSMFKGQDVWDTEVREETSIVFLGWTIWKTEMTFINDFTDKKSNDKVGFGKA